MELWRCDSGDLMILSLFTATFRFSIEIPDDAQINDKLYTFPNVLNQRTNL